MWTSTTFVLAIITAPVADVFVSVLQPTAQSLGLPELFLGLIIVPMVGNIPENLVGLVAAWRGDMDFAMAVQGRNPGTEETAARGFEELSQILTGLQTAPLAREEAVLGWDIPAGEPPQCSLRFGSGRRRYGLPKASWKVVAPRRTDGRSS